MCGTDVTPRLLMTTVHLLIVCVSHHRVLYMCIYVESLWKHSLWSELTLEINLITDVVNSDDIWPFYGCKNEPESIFIAAGMTQASISHFCDFYSSCPRSVKAFFICVVFWFLFIALFGKIFLVTVQDSLLLLLSSLMVYCKKYPA